MKKCGFLHLQTAPASEGAGSTSGEPAAANAELAAEPAAPDTAAAAAAAAATAAAALGQLAAALTTQYQEQAEAAAVLSPPNEPAAPAGERDGNAPSASAAVNGASRSPVPGEQGPVDVVAAAAKALAGLSHLVTAKPPTPAPAATPDAAASVPAATPAVPASAPPAMQRPASNSGASPAAVVQAGGAPPAQPEATQPDQ